MKYLVENEHIHYFQKQGYIEFEGALTALQVQELQKFCQQTLSSRHQKTFSSLWQRDAQFLEGRDLFLDQEPLKKLLMHKTWGTIAYELTTKKPLRLVMDQFFSFSPKRAYMKTDPLCEEFFSRRLSLEEFCPLQGIVCGMMVGLQGERAPTDPAKEPDVFPHQVGNVVFFQPRTPIDFPVISQTEDPLEFLLVVFGSVSTVYAQQPLDPLTHSLKRHGYEFGDVVKDKSHPVVYR